jgi:GAF domain-containing protein
MDARITNWFRPPVYADREQTRIARTLYILLYVLLIGSALATIIRLISGELLGTAVAASILFVACLFLLVLVRRGQFTIPSYAAPILVLVLFSIAIAQDQGLHDIGLPSLTLAIVLAALMLGQRGAALLTGLTILIVTLLGIGEMTGRLQSTLSATTGIDDIIIIALEFAFIGLLVSIMVSHLRQSLAEARQANAELQTLSATLERKVDERVKDLELATEIGANLAQVRDMDDLLNNAVNLIRDRFNLYHAQIYLLNKAGDVLQLRAGTGETGRELVRRGHRLPVGPGSITGTAAATRRPVIVQNTTLDPLFRPNSLLPLTRSEFAIPLLAGDQVVGVLDLQSNELETLNESGLAPFEVLSSQLAVAIENANLLAEARQARAEVESYAQRITREGWLTYLDAVERPHFVGYAFDGEKTMPTAVPLTTIGDENIAQTPIVIVGETIGAVQVEGQPDHQWTAEELEFMHNVAQKVGQQVEILRSLDEAAYYRQEAERTLRRLTHEGWQTHQKATAVTPGFVYNAQEVRPLVTHLPADAALIREPLRVHNQVIGELAVAQGDRLAEREVAEVTAVVAAQLSQHLENLRLAQATEQALAESQKRRRELSVLNNIAQSAAALLDTRQLLETVKTQIELVLPVDSFIVALYDAAQNRLDYAMLYDAATGYVTNPPPLAVQPHLHSYHTIHTGAPQLILLTAEELAAQQATPPDNVLPVANSITASRLFAPLIGGSEVIGVLSVQSSQLNAYTAQDLALFTGVAGYVSTALQNARLFAQTQARAEELAAINQIAQIVAQVSDREQILATVHKQLQRIMAVDAYFVAIYDADSETVEYPYIYDSGQVYRYEVNTLSPTSRVTEVLRNGEMALINRTPAEMAEIAAKEQPTMLGDTAKVSASLLYVPLKIGQATVGVLSVQSYRENAYSASDATLLTGIANYVAVALDNARLLNETEERLREGQLLQELSASINAAVDAENVLQTAARELGRALGLNTYVYLQDPANSQEVAALAATSHTNGNA